MWKTIDQHVEKHFTSIGSLVNDIIHGRSPIVISVHLIASSHLISSNKKRHLKISMSLTGIKRLLVCIIFYAISFCFLGFSFLPQQFTLLWFFLYKVTMIIHPWSDFGFKLLSIYCLAGKTAATRSPSSSSKPGNFQQPCETLKALSRARFVPSGSLLSRNIATSKDGDPLHPVDIIGSFYGNEK